MTWIFLIIFSIIIWGITDVLLKKSLNVSDSLSQFKTFIWIGLMMAPVGLILIICSDTLIDSIRLLRDNLYLIPLCIFYIIAMFFGILGTKHLDASIVSPLENIDGAIAAIILYFFFLFTDRSHIIEKIGVVDILATIIIVISIIFLGIQEHRLSKQEISFDKMKRKNRFGALVLIFPIIYNIVDAVSMVAVSITVSGEMDVSIPDIDFLIFECVGFALFSVIAWLYLLIFKKHLYNPFKKMELSRCGAGIGETLGTMAFTFAVAINPVLTAPITSSYCLVTIVMARIFLKERLTQKQYLSLAFLVVGIALLGVSEIFSV